jgi:hypothetical protein
VQHERSANAITPEIEAQVSALGGMGLGALRDFWRSQWGVPPRLRSTQMLRMIIAWRLQAAAEGGLDQKARIRLTSKSIPRRPRPPIGTRLTREYRGVLYSVEIVDGAVSYAGRRYRSLTHVASEITGTHWNGPRFFGLHRLGAP